MSPVASRGGALLPAWGETRRRWRSFVKLATIHFLVDCNTAASTVTATCSVASVATARDHGSSQDGGARYVGRMYQGRCVGVQILREEARLFTRTPCIRWGVLMAMVVFCDLLSSMAFSFALLRLFRFINCQYLTSRRSSKHTTNRVRNHH